MCKDSLIYVPLGIPPIQIGREPLLGDTFSLLTLRIVYQMIGAISPIRLMPIRRSNGADCSSDATAGTAPPSTKPTRQMRQDTTWTPAVKVPSANSVRTAIALVSAFIMRFTLANDMRLIASGTRRPRQSLRPCQPKPHPLVLSSIPLGRDEYGSEYEPEHLPIRRHRLLGETRIGDAGDREGQDGDVRLLRDEKS